MSDDRKILEEMRQPYRTPSERAEQRKLQAQVGMFNTQPERPEDAPDPMLRLTVWWIQDTSVDKNVAYIKCSSRSGAKIYAHNTLGWKGPFVTDVVNDLEVAKAVELGYEIHVPQFETVQQFAARVEAENKEKRR